MDEIADYLFELLLQGVVREFSRVYSNVNRSPWQEHDDHSSCSEWFGKILQDTAEVGGLSISKESLDEFDCSVRFTTSDLSFTVELSGKRIGMYGPRDAPIKSEAEWIAWFHRTIMLLSVADRENYQKRLSRVRS